MQGIKQFFKKMNFKKWCILFFIALLVGFIAFIFSVKIIFKPEWLEVDFVSYMILTNLGNADLKEKAYYPPIILITPAVLVILSYILSKVIRYFKN